MKEIEYKFLLKNLPKQTRDYESRKIHIVQYYFDKIDAHSLLKKLDIGESYLKKIEYVRLRIEKSNSSMRYILNAKSSGKKIRDEFKKEISYGDASKLLSKKIIGKIKKY